MDKQTLALYAMLAGNGNGRDQLLESLAVNGGELSPRQQLVLDYLQQSAPDDEIEQMNAGGGEDYDFGDAAEFDFEERSYQAADPTAVEPRDRLRRKFLGMQVELSELRQRNEVFAHALGACHCWGYDPECADCKGKGAPAYYQVDRPLFDELVKPAVESVYGVQPRRGPVPAPDDENNDVVNSSKGEST